MNRLFHLVVPALALAVQVVCASASAQQYPARPIRIVIGYPAGTTFDGAGRPLAVELSRRLGQPFVFDYKPGANTTIGAKSVATAAPDGYTLFFSNAISSHPIFNLNNAVDANRELTPISMVSTLPYYFVSRQTLPVTSLAEMIAYAKANPGKLRHGAAVASWDLMMQVVKDRTGIASESIPYKAAAPLTIALLNAEVDWTVSSVQAFLPHIQAGTLRALFMTGTARSAQLPNVPTSIEVGLAGFHPTANFGMWAPPGTPREIVQRLGSEIAAAARIPEVGEQIRKGSGSEPWGSTSEELGRHFEAEAKFWADAARLANYKPQ